jgi:hypothetical protein
MAARNSGSRPCHDRVSRREVMTAMDVSWEPPPPRKGAAGAWDKFIGPGATRAEFWILIAVSLAAGAAVPAYALAKDLGWNTSRLVVGGLLAMDLGGGVFANATSAAKRWYHRRGQGFIQHLSFVALHGMHVFLVAWLFRSMDWRFFLIVYGYLLATTIFILSTPLYLQRPLALLVTTGAFLLDMHAFNPVAGMQWFVPVLFLKLTMGHLLKEAPFQPEGRGKRGTQPSP